MNQDTDLPKVLMVDDKPANLLALERLLEDMPVEVFKASNGNDALRLTLHHDFALALLDIQMPGMDGYELAQFLRQEEKTARMPFIFISAIYTDHINIFEGYEKGAFSYIVKPFEPEILINKVKLFIDLHRHEQQLKRRTLELEQINSELESFSYAVSHDLRAPLRAIDGFGQALQEDCSDNLGSEGLDYLSRIRKATQRMGGLIDDLLDLAQVTRSPINRERVDLGKVAQEIAEELSAEHDHNVEFNGRVEPVDGDARLLRIALWNLLTNAWKFTAGSDHPLVELSESEIDGRRTIHISDNGVGFDMAYADKLFDAFQRLHSPIEFPGNGIGLATVKRIVRKHGGDIWAESAPNQGATFHFTLG